MTDPSTPELAPPLRLLLGPGPSMVHPRVLRAMSTPLLGHLPTATQWRIGLMGESAQQESVLAVLAALEQALARQGKGPRPGTAVSAPLELYARQG